MTLYFENPVNFPETGSISVNAIWHQTTPLLAVASFSQERGGFITIFDELGEPVKDVNFPVYRNYQVTALSWHPEKPILTTAWENGDIKLWNGSDKEFLNVVGPHKSPITLLEFSEKGGRLVSSDSIGSVVGWKIDLKGQTNLIFHLDLKETVTHLAFRLTIKSHVDFDVEGLARAAVNGDEHALDMFSNWRPKTTARKFKIQDGSDNMCFFLATQTGSLYYVNSSGTCMEVLNTGTSLSSIVYHPTKEAVIVVFEGFTVGYYSVDSLGRLSEKSKVKLSGRTHSRSVGNQGIAWAGSSSLAILTGDLSVRIWDIDSNDNYVLPTTMKSYKIEDKSNNVSEIFTCLTYSKLNHTLCAGTNVGRIYFWSRNLNILPDNVEDTWELNNVSTISGTIKQLTWGSVLLRLPLLSVNCVTAVYIMKEQNVCSAFSEKLWATQKTANQILLECETNAGFLLDVGQQVSDVAIDDSCVVVTNGRSILVYEVTWKSSNQIKDDFSVKLANSFVCDNDGILISRYSQIIAINSQKVVVYTRGGAVIGQLTSSLSEGEPIGMDWTANFLTLFTIEGYLKLYDIGESLPPKLVTPVRNLYDMFEDFGEIIQAKANANGKKIALTIAAANLIPDGRLYIWDIETDQMVKFNFRKYGSLDVDYNDDPDCVEDDQGFKDVCSGRVPISFYWAEEDARLLICNAKKLKSGNEKKGFGALINKREKKTLINEDHIIITMFISAENNIKIHDIKAVDAEAKLLGISVPYIVTLQKSIITRELMSDFAGLETCDRKAKEAVLDFSYNLALGNMDAAFRSIKLVQSKGVWESLAKMCVKTRRLDVAAVCLGHMGDAKAARALRLAVTDESLCQEAQVAVLAVHLGLLDDAKQLYRDCERYDLLNKLLRSCNKLPEALALAEAKDRINMKNTEHAYARSLEQKGEVRNAIEHYEKANTHRYDVPRMLNEDAVQLQSFMMKTRDKEMLKWWGQYVESQGDMNSALKIYSKAGDIYSQVRVLCFLGDESKAMDLARQHNDKAAFYHMARYYETIGSIEEAVNCFMKATAYCNAVRLCKEHDLAEELWNLGVVVQNREKIEIAKYFEERGDLEKAVILYHRGGLLHNALDLAFKTRQYDVLQDITTELDAGSDPALVEKCAEYFVSNEQYDKAVDLMAIAKKYQEAIDLCIKHNVQLTEDLTEKLTPEKETVDEDLRLRILESLAESLMVQGDYHLATKKFTQAGDKFRAMKALLKSGDTDKIIFFAGISRQREIYIMAANYLQSLDWQNQPEVLRNIIAFYSKGKALDLLANFYVACAQVEIDEFQNYEKAFGALTEASRCLQKITSPKDPMQIQRAMDIVQERLVLVKRFVDIRRLFDRGDSQAGLTQCRQLLITSDQELEVAVRRGDIYALMIHNCVKQGRFEEGKQLCGELREVLAGSTPLTYYVNREVLEALAGGLGVAVTSFVPMVSEKLRDGGGDDGQEVVDEEIVEE